VEKEDSGLEANSKLKIPQMRAVDKARLKKYIGTISNDILARVEKAIKLHLAMD
jgi:mRNA-degrading endonuclease toxin of MazEF toxin-antitoxin module